jgi:NAD(P)H-dependent FMN reductase
MRYAEGRTDAMPRALIVSTSLDVASRSERLATLYRAALIDRGVDAELISLKDYPLPPFDNGDLESVPNYKSLHALVSDADALVLATPIYNWGTSAELKRFIEIIGSTPSGGTLRGAFYDKLVTFLCAAGLPHSYMAFTPTAIALMLDFRCIINPYHVYVHNRHWVEAALNDEAITALNRSADVLVELMECLAARTYRSDWGT